MIELFIKGGPIMWPLLAVSIVALATTLERVRVILSVRRALRGDHKERLLKLVAEGRLEDAAELGEGSAHLVAKVLSFGIRNRDDYEEAINLAADTELEELGKGLSILDTIVTLAPLLGLLGTVTGMITAFGLLGGSELEAPSAITGGIAEALIATAYGLAIAIVCLLPLNYLTTQKELLEREIERAATELQLKLKSYVEAPRTARIKAA